MTEPKTMAGTRLFAPDDPALVEDPYPAYRQLRDQEPVAYLAEQDLWLLSRYDDVAWVLREPIIFSSKLGMNPDLSGSGEDLSTGVSYRFGAPDVRLLIATDPPEHQLFRRAVAGAFSPVSMARYAERVRALAESCVTDLIAGAEAGDGDFYAQVAEPLPVLVLAEVFGIPADMHADFRAWTELMTADLHQDQAGPQAGGRGMAMFRYFRSQLRRPVGEAGPTLFQALAQAGEVGVSERELLAFCAFLLFAGIETTTSMMTNLFAALVRFPEVSAQLRRQPELIGAAVEEGMRFDTSVQILWRGTTKPVDVHGVRLPAGARVLVAFGSANRDERQFSEPDRFRLDRQSNPHVGFGGGPHFCLGARLARLQLTAVFRDLLARTTTIEVAAEPTRLSSLVVRGFTRQPVRIRRR